eukprot:7267166-Prymnesium_polylepis.1
MLWRLSSLAAARLSGMLTRRRPPIPPRPRTRPRTRPTQTDRSNKKSFGHPAATATTAASVMQRQ